MVNIKIYSAMLLFLNSWICGAHDGGLMCLWAPSTETFVEMHDNQYHINFNLLHGYPKHIMISKEYIDFWELLKYFNKAIPNRRGKCNDSECQRKLIEYFMQSFFDGNAKVVDIEVKESDQVLINFCLRSYNKDRCGNSVLAEWGQYGPGLSGGEYIRSDGERSPIIISKVVLSSLLDLNNSNASSYLHLLKYVYCVLDYSKQLVISNLCQFFDQYIIAHTPQIKPIINELLQNAKLMEETTKDLISINTQLPFEDPTRLTIDEISALEQYKARIVGDALVSLRSNNIEIYKAIKGKLYNFDLNREGVTELYPDYDEFYTCYNKIIILYTQIAVLADKAFVLPIENLFIILLTLYLYAN